MAQVDDRERLHEALVSAIAAEHRLHLAAAAEEAARQCWEARAALAQRKEALDLAEAARQRAAEHCRLARAYHAECLQQQEQIAQLKAALLGPGPLAGPSPSAPDGGDPVDRQLAALEREARLERDLAELKRQLGRA